MKLPKNDPDQVRANALYKGELATNLKEWAERNHVSVANLTGTIVDFAMHGRLHAPPHDLLLRDQSEQEHPVLCRFDDQINQALTNWAEYMHIEPSILIKLIVVSVLNQQTMEPPDGITLNN